jgi:rhodanese-related sulfurtransferase
MMNLPKTFWRDIRVFWLLATSALCLGMLMNQFRDKPLPLVYESKAERLQSVVSKVSVTMPVNSALRSEHLSDSLSLDAFRVIVEEKKVLVLDARPEIFHRLGHVPGALSLPRDEFEKGYANLQKLLEVNKERPIVLYCSSSSCQDSGLVQKALRDLGYTHVSIFHGGWSAWTQAGLTEEKNQ